MDLGLETFSCKFGVPSPLQLAAMPQNMQNYKKFLGYNTFIESKNLKFESM